MRVLTDYPDAEKTMANIIGHLAKVYAVLPSKWTPPAITVQRVGGVDDGITDSPRIDVSVLSTSRSQAWDLAEKARQTILAAAGTEVKGVLVDNAFTDVPHQQFPDELDSTLRKVTTTYRLSFRRPVSTKENTQKG